MNKLEKVRVLFLRDPDSNWRFENWELSCDEIFKALKCDFRNTLKWDNGQILLTIYYEEDPFDLGHKNVDKNDE